MGGRRRRLILWRQSRRRVLVQAHARRWVPLCRRNVPSCLRDRVGGVPLDCADVLDIMACFLDLCFEFVIGSVAHLCGYVDERRSPYSSLIEHLNKVGYSIRAETDSN